MTEPLTMTARVEAPIAEVRRALTDPAALRVWLAEHAEVDLPHRYAFWGRHTPEGDAPHQSLSYADERGLRFTWLLDGEETTVEIDLVPESEKVTLITLSQTHFDYQDVITGKSIRGVLQTFWALAIANLVDHLEGREPTPKPDFTSTTPELRASVEIDSPMEEVFDSLIDSEKASAWFGMPIGIEPRVGGRFAMGGLDVDPQPAKILDLVPGERLSVDWGTGTGVGTWELAGSGGKTSLTIVQSGFDTARPPYPAWTGILSGMAELRRFHELSDWRPIWVQEEAA
ncbi:SRPBCC domain-containing protein [Spongiactinospora rosea]|uniref:SRPBCC domain-containing protein n=1 Tax=Spongiactinospora rosea TaxID=2248750 RepID=A0A366M1K5_9ACTN|nr:SRPBCC family protein [Spongiactinospora rosea]RBQ19917.1 SRPBCC domain-containing protein [Spongiactinospora rosea]